MTAGTTDASARGFTLAGETPEVIVPRGRTHLTYARAGNLILPLRFARKMPEWRRPGRASWAATDRRRVQARSGHPRWGK
jgi:hypothetical protein